MAELTMSSNDKPLDDIGSYVHDQGTDGTCYAHAVATVITAAAISLGREQILKVLIEKYGTSGASTVEAGKSPQHRHLLRRRANHQLSLRPPS